MEKELCCRGKMKSKCLTVFFSSLLVVILIASFLFLFVPTKESVSVPENAAVTKLVRRGKSLESDDRLAVALFDYSNNNFSIQKGDLLSIAEEKPNAKLWKVRSLDGKNGSVFTCSGFKNSFQDCESCCCSVRF